MPAPKYDYIDLKRQYVQGEMSLRELCRKNDIISWSAVAKKAHEEDWDERRHEFRRQVEDRSLEALAVKRANKIADITLDALDVIHAAILKMAADMNATEEVEVNGKTVKRPAVRMTPRDLDILIARFQTIIGQPSAVSENRNLNANLNADAPPEQLRAILAALSGSKQPVGRPAIPASTRGPSPSRPD